ncbi:MAG: flagellar basal body P-ring protein FlgI [Planctomycetota bacterium]
MGSLDRLHRLVRTAACFALAALCVSAQANTVRDITRIRGQGESVLQGLGLVIGLNGSGDSGTELAMARPLAETLRRLGNPLPSFDELRNSRSVALVMVTCTVPRTGARMDDTLDVTVSVLNSATSIDGGELFIAPLIGPKPGDPVFAFAQGSVVAEQAERPTVARVRGGARMVRDILTTPPAGGAIDLILDPVYVGYAAATHVAQQINDAYFLTTDPTSEKIARVLDERTIRVLVPEVELEAPAAFIADVLETDILPSQLGVPASVVANTATGAIVVTGDVRISPSVITHRDLVITTTLPTPEPTPEAPIVDRERWATLQTDATTGELARIDGLLTAFEQLDIPATDQIAILRMLHSAGKLHAKLIIDGVEL